jgi:hypothetical protein
MKHIEKIDSEFTEKNIYNEDDLEKLDKDLEKVFENEAVRTARVVYEIELPDGKSTHFSKTINRELLERIHENNNNVPGFMADAAAASENSQFEQDDIIEINVETFSDI